MPGPWREGADPLPALWQRRITSMIRLCFLIVGACLTAGIGLADWRQVQLLDPGTPILVRAGFVIDAGKLVRSTPDSVLIETRAGQVTVVKDDIDEVVIFRSRPDRVRRGVLWGAIAAGVTAAISFPVFANSSRPNLATPSMLTVSNGATFGLSGYMQKTQRIYRRSK